jgi:hypothetical protein
MVISLTFDSNRYCVYYPSTSAESCPERRDAFANGLAESAPLINPPGGRYTIARLLEYSTGVAHKYKVLPEKLKVFQDPTSLLGTGKSDR